MKRAMRGDVPLSVDPDSPWVRGTGGVRRRRGSGFRTAKRLVVLACMSVLAGTAALVLVSGPLGRRGEPRGASLPPVLMHPSSDPTGAQGERHLRELQAARAKGAQYGVVDGCGKELTSGEAAALVARHRIREAIRALRGAYLGRGDLTAARRCAVEELRKHPSDVVEREIDVFRRFLGSDAGALALFEEVEHAVRN